MLHSTIAPLSVVPYARNQIIEFVRYITNWSQRSEVDSKTQLNYLCKYLEVDHIACKSIVFESDYVDRHFLEDYSEYYARCFADHPRRCSRLHFFSTAVDEVSFRENLVDPQEDYQKQLQDSYIGFIVIRPIPHTFFAKICVKPYDALLNSTKHRILRKDIEVSLFGIGLKVPTIPFVEQDKVVSACATSAVWTALSASQAIPESSLPSPSAITKSASHAMHDGIRTFPTAGLTPSQVARALKHYGLEPSKFWRPEMGFDALKAHLYSYLSNSSPVLLGGAVYEKDGKEFKLLGSHLICAVGFALGTQTYAGGIRLLSSAVEKIYVHDDRYGPYVRLSMTREEFKSDGKRQWGLEVSLHDGKKTYFVPDVGIVGLYHKIRIAYESVFGACNALYYYLEATYEDMKRSRVAKLTESEAQVFEATAKSIKTFIDCTWDIALTTNTALKEEIRRSDSFLMFNGAVDRTALLLPNMPRHIWRCRIRDEANPDTVLSDILFDATEVPQGRVLIGCVSYDIGAVRLWQMVERCIAERDWQASDVDSRELQEGISCFLKFFEETKDRTYLNNQYGPLGLPRRELKDGELDYSQNITQRRDTLVVRRGFKDDSLAKFLHEDKKYIWVINEFGDAVVGEDVVDANGFKGHPTLIDGKPGRVAGELAYDATSQAWLANLRSRAYSSHLNQSSSEAQRYLKNVVDNNFPGIRVSAQK